MKFKPTSLSLRLESKHGNVMGVTVSKDSPPQINHPGNITNGEQAKADHLASLLTSMLLVLEHAEI